MAIPGLGLRMGSESSTEVHKYIWSILPPALAIDSSILE